MNTQHLKLLVILLFAGLLIFVSPIRTIRSQSRADFGDPLPGLTAGQLALFRQGQLVFESKKQIEEGLGPVFNDFGCAQCHDQPATGGASQVMETNFGRMINGVFDPMIEYGGPVRQTTGITIPGLCNVPGEMVPPEATIMTQRQAQPLFGLGLIEQIPESAILAHADPDDADGDGISGRANLVKDPLSHQLMLGRFGWKAQLPSIPAFAATALLNEMGITTMVFPNENNPQGKPVICDIVPDPEDTDDDGDGVSDGMMALTNFMRLLGPPPRGPIDDSVRAGEMIFGDIGCAKCHIPTLYTGPSAIAALSHTAVNLYSDLLLHDMGSLGDGMFDSLATGSQMRTAPLWGLRATGKYLHDGRAATLEEAITAHAGEAEASKRNFLTLTTDGRSQLLAFLNSL
jgi:CxxC motif-containing protein (DUF1111 family)